MLGIRNGGRWISIALIVHSLDPTLHVLFGADPQS